MNTNTLFNEGYLDIDEDIETIVEDAKKDGKYKIEEIPIDKIVSPKFHDRKTYSEESIVELAENIKEHGLVHPIVVRKVGDKYERIVGFRRIKAYKFLGRTTIPAIVLDIPEEKAIALMLSENIQRENLNVYDAVYSQVQYLTYILGFKTFEDTIKFINRVRNFRLGSIKIEKFSEEEKKKAILLEKIIQKLTGKGLRGFIEKVRVISVHPIVKKALIKNNWGYKIAVELDKLAKANKLDELKELISQIEENDYSYKQIKDKVDYILGKNINPIVKLNRNLVRNYSKLPEDKKREVDELLNKINNILSTYGAK